MTASPSSAPRQLAITRSWVWLTMALNLIIWFGIVIAKMPANDAAGLIGKLLCAATFALGAAAFLMLLKKNTASVGSSPLILKAMPVVTSLATAWMIYSI